MRPDFTIFSAAFLVAFVLIGRCRFRSVLVVFGLAVALPVVDELFRMAYYGSVVPNTAIVKEASLSRWSQGWVYVKDFFGPYVLLLPVVVVIAVFLLRLVRAGSGSRRNLRIVAGFTMAAGCRTRCVRHASRRRLHARPHVAAIAVRGAIAGLGGGRSLVAVVAAAAVVIWAIVCGSVACAHPIRASIRSIRGSTTARSISKTGIGDERLYYLRLSASRAPGHPRRLPGAPQWALAG